MAKLGFPYLPRPLIDPKANLVQEVFTPYTPIRVSHDHGNPTAFIDALVDSGADRNLFPIQLGEMLGINFKKTNPKIIYGIGNAQIKAYSSKINVWLNNTKYPTYADFSLSQQTLILGREGFFNLFKTVTFEEQGRFLYITTF